MSSAATPAADAASITNPASPASDAAATRLVLPVGADTAVRVEPMLQHKAVYPFTQADVIAWRAALATNGYLFLSDLLPREEVFHARRCVVERLRERGVLPPLEAEASDEDALFATAEDPTQPANLLSDIDLQRDPAVVSVLEHPRLFELFHALLAPLVDDAEGKPDQEQATVPSVHVWTSRYKWLRGMPQGQCTGLHLDRVYMQAASPLLSLWLPLGDLTPAHGNLVVARASHRSAQFQRLRDEYGRSDAGAKGNGTTSGWIDVAHYTNEPVEWVSSPARCGDVVILDLTVLHCTSRNVSDEYRLSCDTRWTATCSSADDEDSPSPPSASIRFKRQDDP